MFTDVALLADISRSSASAAVGVLTNRNVTGPAYLQVLDRAALSAANVESTELFPLTLGRTATEQAALVLAAGARSSVAMHLLIPHLTPGAALTLWDRAPTVRVRDRAGLRRGLVALVNTARFHRLSDHDAYPPFIAALREHDDCPSLVVATAFAARTARDLKTLAGDLATADLTQWGAHHRDAMLLATVEHPEAVPVWAAHGGDLGMLIAAADHRLAPDLLSTLACESVATSCILVDTLAGNLTMAPAVVRGLLAPLASTILAVNDLSLRTEALTCWYGAAKRCTDRELGWGEATSVEVLAPGSPLVGGAVGSPAARLLLQLTPLTALAALTVRPGHHRTEALVQQLHHSWLPADALRRIRTALALDDPNVPRPAEAPVPHPADDENRVESHAASGDRLDPDYAAKTERHRLRSTAAHRVVGFRNPLTEYLCRELLTAPEWVALYDLHVTNQQTRNQPISPLVEQAQYARPSDPDPSPGSFAGLLPDALGGI